MLQIGDVVCHRDGGADMTVEKIEKCLDCNRVLVTTVFYEGLNQTPTHSEFPIKHLVLVRRNRPQARNPYQGYGDLLRRMQTAPNTQIWTMEVPMVPEDPEPDPF